MPNFPALFPRQAFNPSCPSGGEFYACQDGARFVGCCNSKACPDGCSDGNLQPASFDTGYYGEFRDQECPTGSRWYTCNFTDPPFMGCCKKNACTYGCVPGDLTAGFLSSNENIAKDYMPPGAAESSTSSASPTSSSISASPSSTAAVTHTITATPSEMASNVKHTSPGIIVGASVGGVAAVAILLALLVVLIRRKAARSRQHMSFRRAENWGTGKETVASPEKGEAAAMMPQESRVENITATPELMSSPAPTYTSMMSELDGTDSMQRAVAISPEPSTTQSSPQLPRYSDSPRQA